MKNFLYMVKRKNLGKILLLLILTVFSLNSCSDDHQVKPVVTDYYTKEIAQFDTQLPPSYQINSVGQIAWTAEGSQESAIYFYNNGISTKISQSGAYCNYTDINNQGKIVWSQYNGSTNDIYLYDKGQVNRLSGENANNLYPDINNSGQIVWQSAVSGSSNIDINLYTGGNIQNINNDSSPDWIPQINDEGKILWCRGEGNSAKSFLYNGSTSINIGSDINFDDTLYEKSFYIKHNKINSKGNAVWEATQNNNSVVYLYSNSVAGPVMSGGSTENKFSEINNTGQIVFEGYDGSTSHIYLYQNGSTTCISQGIKNNAYPHINNSGQVIWQGKRGANTDIFLYDTGKITQISGNGTENILPVISDNGDILWVTREWQNGWHYRKLYIASKNNKTVQTIGVSGDYPVMPPHSSGNISTEGQSPPVIEAGKTKFSFIIFGDSRGKDSSWVIGDVMNSKFLQFMDKTVIPSFNPDFVIFNGDCATMADVSKIPGIDTLTLPVWINNLQNTYNSKKLYMTKGNHELYNWCGWYKVKYQKDFQSRFTYLPDNGGTDYKYLDYSFQYGNSTFILFDSFYSWPSPWYKPSDYGNYGDITDDQLSWLKTQLNSTGNPVHTFVISHAPVFSDEGDKEFDKMKTLWQLMDDKKADVYFGAHEHLYSRKTIDGSINPSYKNNVVQIVAGSGGAQPDSSSDVKVDKNEWHINLCIHFVIVLVDGNTVTTQAYKVTESGDTYQVENTPFDTVVITKN